MLLRSISSYASEIRPRLVAGVFAPARSRLLWLPVHLTVAALATAAISLRWLPWPALLPLPLLIGMSFAGLTFLGHETLHGAVVRGKLLRRLVGWVGFLPFVVSPRLWVAWHNKVHHGHTNHAGSDPDAYPTLTEYDGSMSVRVVTDCFSPGRRRLRGVISLLIGFSIQSAHVLFDARRRGYLTPNQHWLALLESAVGVALWAALGWWIGPLNFLLCFVLPLLVANSIVMGHILTNHSLSPLTAINDPLANSLSVTGPRWMEWVTLGFGFHVEHHLFPAMSARHASKVRDVLMAEWPDRYQSLPLWRALLALHHTPRVYKNDATLIDPHTRREWPALARRTDQRGEVATRSARALADSPCPSTVPKPA